MEKQNSKSVKTNNQAWCSKEQMNEEADINKLLDYFSSASNDNKTKNPVYTTFKKWENASDN
jgi:hypothetical protein